MKRHPVLLAHKKTERKQLQRAVDVDAGSSLIYYSLTAVTESGVVEVYNKVHITQCPHFRGKRKHLEL